MFDFASGSPIKFCFENYSRNFTDLISLPTWNLAFLFWKDFILNLFFLLPYYRTTQEIVIFFVVLFSLIVAI